MQWIIQKISNSRNLSVRFSVFVLLFGCTPVEVGKRPNLSSERMDLAFFPTPTFTPPDMNPSSQDQFRMEDRMMQDQMISTQDQMPVLADYDLDLEVTDQEFLADLSVDQFIPSTPMRTLQCASSTECDYYICQCSNGVPVLFQSCIEGQCLYDDVNVCNQGGACNGYGIAQSARAYRELSGANCMQPNDCPPYSCACQNGMVQNLQICLNNRCLASDEDCRIWDTESQFNGNSNVSCVPYGGSL